MHKKIYKVPVLIIQHTGLHQKCTEAQYMDRDQVLSG